MIMKHLTNKFWIHYLRASDFLWMRLRDWRLSNMFSKLAVTTLCVCLCSFFIFLSHREASESYFSVSLDALLVGHEAGITSLSWSASSLQTETPCILSTSIDSSLILWSPSSSVDDDSLWIIKQRLGDLGGQRLGGFVGGLWTSEGNCALAYGWNGCWRRWYLTDQTSYQWTEGIAVTGHNDEVRGITWCPTGEYLLSTGYVVCIWYRIML